jgi:hypothetical protein
LNIISNVDQSKVGYFVPVTDLFYDHCLLLFVSAFSFNYDRLAILLDVVNTYNDYLMSERTDNANDYALAKVLNECVITIFKLMDYERDLPDYSALNRSYVLLREELIQIYARQPELQNVGGSICWKVMQNIELFHENIGEYKSLAFDYAQSGADYGDDHNSNVNMLCIKANIDNPVIPSQIQKLLTEAKSNIKEFKFELAKMNATLSIEVISGKPVVELGEEKYRLSAMRDGTVLTLISYCLDKHPNEQIDLDTLKSELKEAGLSAHGLSNLKESIRNSHFGHNKPLQPFVDAYPKAILVRKTTELTDDQTKAIKQAGS